MKISYFTHGFPYRNPLTGEELKRGNEGGVQNYAYHLAVHMARKGHDIEIHTTGNEHDEEVADYGNIRVIRYRKHFTIESTPVSLQFITTPLLKQNDAEIFHAHLGTPPAPIAAYFFARKSKKPFIVTYHGDNFANYGSLSRKLSVSMVNHFFNDFILSHSTGITALSESNMNESAYLPKYRDKISIIPNGVNPEDFEVPFSKEECRERLGLPGECPIILFMGSLVPIKAPHILLQAVQKILEQHHEVYLVIAGDGTLRTQLMETAKQMNIDQHIRFAGYVTELKALYYRSADIFLLPSYSECFPTVLLEASASSLPMVVSSLETLKGVIKDGYNGVFASVGDAGDFADKIISLLAHDDIRRTMGQHARKRVNEFTWDSIAEKTEQMYRKCEVES